jgi:TPP-dependent pyruvate/acetoin dehydrogenase alpha subunit
LSKTVVARLGGDEVDFGRPGFTIAAPVILKANMTTTRNATAVSDSSFSLISNQKLLVLYAAMLGCRRICEANGDQRRHKRAPGFKSIRGCEAAMVGAAIDLRPGDTVNAPHWPDAVLKTINPAVSIRLLQSLDARAAHGDGEDRDIAMFFGDSRNSAQTAWNRAAKLLDSENLPVLFISLTAERPSPRGGIVTPASTAKPRYPLPVISVDGSDVVAMYRVASEAISLARRGLGPTFIECVLAKRSDPLQNMARYLVRKGLLDDQSMPHTHA